MRFMLIEHYTAGPLAVYERAGVHGRMLPEGLRYIDSWVVDDDRLDRCFQLMEADDPGLFDVWRERWQDLDDLRSIRSSTQPKRRECRRFVACGAKLPVTPNAGTATPRSADLALSPRRDCPTFWGR
jgi:hypothetical protein